jgi:hypothetical protein
MTRGRTTAPDRDTLAGYTDEQLAELHTRATEEVNRRLTNR